MHQGYDDVLLSGILAGGWRETTAYEALHLACDGLALLMEPAIRSYGKQVS